MFNKEIKRVNVVVTFRACIYIVPSLLQLAKSSTIVY